MYQNTPMQQFPANNQFQQTNQQHYQPQSAQLPFNPTAPQWNSQQYTVNNCPVNLSILQDKINPRLFQYLTGIAIACIDSLQSRAGQNTLRMFLYNQLAVNQYNNQHFLMLVKVVCDITEYYAANGMAIEQAIVSAVDLSIQFAAFNNLRNHPGLQQYLDPSMMGNLAGLEQKQNQISQQVMQYQQQKAMNQQQVYNGYQQNTGGYLNQPVNNNNSLLQQNGMPSTWNTPSTGMFSSPNQNVQQASDSGSTMVEGWAASNHNSNNGQQDWRNNVAVAEQPQNTRMETRTDYSPAFSFQPPAAQNPAPDLKVSGVDISKYEKVYHHEGKMMVRQGDPGVVWKPTERFYINPSKSKTCDIYYILHEDGSMEPIIKKITKEEQMERDKHYGPLGCRPEAAKAWDSTLIHNVEEREEYVKRLMETGKVVRAGSFKNIKTAVKDEEIVKDDSYLMITAAEDAWTQADIGMTLTDTEEAPCTAYVKPAFNLTPIVSKTDAQALVSDLKDSATLEQCASKLKAENYTIKSLSDNIQKRNRQVVYGKINRMLTRSVNHYLKYKLGLPGVTIDSFEEDGESITGYLDKNFPSQYSQALRKDQKYIISNVLSSTVDGLIGSEFDQCVREQQLADMDIKDNQPVFLYSKEQYMTVNMFSTEINSDLKNDEIVSVLKDVDPLVYSLCETVIGSADVEEDVDVYGYYIKTLDDVIYEVSRSALNNSIFILGLK